MNDKEKETKTHQFAAHAVGYLQNHVKIVLCVCLCDLCECVCYVLHIHISDCQNIPKHKLP